MENKITTLLPNNLLQEDSKKLNILHEYMEYSNTNKVNYKLTLVMEYLQSRKNLFDVTTFSIEDIIISYGYVPKTGKGKINEQIINIIKFLNDKQLITELNVNVDEIKYNTFVKCKYSGINQKKDDNTNIYKNNSFALLQYDWINTIINNTDKLDVAKLITYLAYIVSRIYNNPKGTDTNRDGGSVSICYPSFDKITKDINVNDNTIEKYNSWLMKNKIIKYKNTGNYYLNSDKNKTVLQGVNIYTIYDINADDNLKQGIEQYKKLYTNRTYISDKAKTKTKTNRQISCTINRIDNLEKQGKATKKQLDKRDELLKNKELKDYNIEDLKAELNIVCNDEYEINDILNYISEGKTWTVEVYLKAIDYVKNGCQDEEIEEKITMGVKRDFEAQFEDNSYNPFDNPFEKPSSNELYDNDINKIIAKKRSKRPNGGF